MKSMEKILNIAPSLYNRFASDTQLSAKRKKQIEERRGSLKVQDSDPQIIRNVIEGLLSYRPFAFTIDDRYLQLEIIMDEIERAREIKSTDKLVTLCLDIENALQKSPGIKNAFLDCLICINMRNQNKPLGAFIKSKF